MAECQISFQWRGIFTPGRVTRLLPKRFENNKNMLNLNSVMLGSKQPRVVAEFYEKVFGRAADMIEGDWYGWSVGNSYLSIGSHSEVKDIAQEPQRVIFNFETMKVKEEFERIKTLGARVIKEPYEMGGGWVATFADPDGNYFQLITPWREK